LSACARSSWWRASRQKTTAAHPAEFVCGSHRAYAASLQGRISPDTALTPEINGMSVRAPSKITVGCQRELIRPHLPPVANDLKHESFLRPSCGHQAPIRRGQSKSKANCLLTRPRLGTSAQ